MIPQDKLNYDRIAKAIEFIQQNHTQQPSLDEVAQHVGLSSFHFQRLFNDWAGVTPKNFLQFINISYAKRLLRESQATLFDTTESIGLSSTSRLHDLFIRIEGMTPGEYKKGASQLKLNYSFHESHFGKLIIASTPKGICLIHFIENQEQGLQLLQSHYPNAILVPNETESHISAAEIINGNWTRPKEIKLHVQGTDFQLKVWEALLKIPYGKLSTYGSIAEEINKPSAARAVGTAIGSNPIAYLIPCHRVIQASGKSGGYMWGPTRKTALLGWEACEINDLDSEPLL